MKSIIAPAFYNEAPEPEEFELDAAEVDEIREEYINHSPTIPYLVCRYSRGEESHITFVKLLNEELLRIDALSEETAHERAMERAKYASADD
jgi:hypothetical protein